MVKNYMEVLVDKFLDDILKHDARYQNICTCQICLDDIRAQALNHLPPFYITCKKGEIYGEFRVREVQNKTDIIASIIAAVEFVSNHKGHE